MITVTIFRSALDDTRETQQIENPVTIQELFPDVDFSAAIISVNGALQDSTYLLQDGDVCAIRLFPEGNGADWLTGVGVGLLVGITVLNFWNPGGWAAAAVLAGGIAAGALGFGIASAAGWSVTGWLANGANADLKSTESLESIPQLRGAKNQSNYGKPVPLVLGKHLFTPMYVGSPYCTIGGEDGEDQYFNALYLLGYGKLKVSDVKLGVIGDLASNAKNTEDGYLTFDGDPFLGNRDKPNDPDNPEIELIQTERESLVYPQTVYEEALSIELSHPKDAEPLNVVRFTAKNPRKVQVEITLPNGLLEYDEKGNKVSASVSISVRWRISRPDNSDGWKEFGRFGADQSSITYTSPVSKITRSKSKVMRFVAEKTFTNYSQVSDSFDTRVIELEIQRTDEQSDSPQIVDKVYLTSIRTWIFDNEKSKDGTLVAQVPVIEKLRNRTARLGFRIKATQNTQGMIDALNCIVESKCRTWDSENKQWGNSDWDIKNLRWTGNSELPSNNPAALALKLLQSPTMGKKAYSDDMLDLDSFGEFYEWCEERGYTCNGVLTAEKRLDEVLALILSTGRAMKILNGPRYGLLIDKPRDYPVMILNSQNVLEASNQKGFDDIPDGFLIRFVNEDDGYQQTEEYVMEDGSTQPGFEAVVETLDLPYITNRKQAFKQAWYQLALRHLRPEIWNRKLSVDGYLIGIGDMVEVQDDTIVVGIGEGGRIIDLDIENDAITKIYTDGDFEVADMNLVYGIKIMQFDGINPGKIRTIPVNDIVAPGLYSDFTVHIPLKDSPVPHAGDLVAFGVYDRITTEALCFGKKENGDGTFDFVLVPYQQGVYDADTAKTIPAYNANITTPQSVGPLHEIPADTATKSDVFELVQQMNLTGPAAVVYDLRPSVNVIKRDNYGGHDPETIACDQVRIEGNTLPEPSYKDLSYITSVDTTSVSYTEPIPVGNWDWIEFILSDGGIELDRERIPVLRNGDMATIYELVPSVNVISRAPDGVTLEPKVISCSQQLIIGASEPQPSNKTIKYRTSLDSTEKVFSDSMTIDPDWEWLEFRLYDGETLLDRKRVPILDSGSSFIFVHLMRDSKALACDEDGFLIDGALSFTNQATLYQGNEKLSPGIAGEICWELEDAPEGMEIDADGLITVSPWTVFNDYNEIFVVAVFEERRYEALFDIIKIYSGTSPIIIDIDNENRQIACLYDGTIKPGQLPLQIQATLYRGVNTVTNDANKDIQCFPGSGQDLFEPYLADTLYLSSPLDSTPEIIWSLENAPYGVEINRYGTVTVSADAALDVFNIIIVKALYRDNEYTKILQITKVLDGQNGQNAVFVDLANEFVSLAANYAGTLDSRTAAITIQASLYSGASAVASGVSWSINPAVSGVSINATSGLVTIATNYTQSTDRAEVNVRATYNGTVYTSTLTIARVKGGADGTPATIYELFPSVDVVVRNADGDATPNTLSCQVQKITGSEAAVYDTSKTIRYITSANSTEVQYNYNSTISIPKAQTGGLTFIEFRLYDGSTLIDRERVPIIQDGKDGKDGIDGKDGAQGDPAPRYLGKTYTPAGATGIAEIRDSVNGTPRSVQAHEGDWVAYVGTDQAGASIWKNGMCIRWNGTAWEQIPIAADGNFESNPYVHALMDLTADAPKGTFMSLLVRELIAKTAMIETLFTQLLQVQNAVFGGERFRVEEDATGNKRLIDRGTGYPGFCLDKDGKLKASNAEISGHIDAASGSFSGELKAASGSFKGTLVVGDTWDTDGNIINQGGTGSLFAAPHYIEILVNRLVAYGNTTFGATINNRNGDTTFLGNRFFNSGHTIGGRNISGNYTAANFYTQANNGIGEYITSNYNYLIIGSLYVTYGSSYGETASMLIQLFRVTKSSSGLISFYGMNSSGVRVVVESSSTSLTVKNRGGATLVTLSSTTNINYTVEVEMTFF